MRNSRSAIIGIIHHLPYPKSNRSDSPYLNHFLQPDTIIPSLASPQSWNRYSYVLNNPINASDPSGHQCVGEPGECLKADGTKGAGLTGTGGRGNRGAGNCSGAGCQGKGGRGASPLTTVKQQMVVDGFYLGGQYPQTLAEMEADIYQGNAVDLIDSLSARQDDVNHSYGIPNVYAGLSYSQFGNGAIDVTGITVANASDYRVFVIRVLFMAKEKQLTPGRGSPGLNQIYEPNPLRIGPQMNSDKFMSIDPHTSRNMQLVPSGNSTNPNNHFGPSSVQSLTIQVYFQFMPQPRRQMLTFDLLP